MSHESTDRWDWRAMARAKTNTVSMFDTEAVLLAIWEGYWKACVKGYIEMNSWVPHMPKDSKTFRGILRGSWICVLSSAGWLRGRMLPYYLFILCISNTFWLSHNALTSNTEGNAILLTCVLSAHLLCPSLSPWVSGMVSLQSTKQILFPLLLPKLHSASWAWLRPEFVQKTLSNNLSFSHTPHQVKKVGDTFLLISTNWYYYYY